MIGRSEQARRRRQVRRQIIQLVAVRRGGYAQSERGGIGAEAATRATADQGPPIASD